VTLNSAAPRFGSARESVKRRILRGLADFLESDIFGVRGGDRKHGFGVHPDFGAERYVTLWVLKLPAGAKGSLFETGLKQIDFPCAERALDMPSK
jgi:hypothetical protein